MAYEDAPINADEATVAQWIGMLSHDDPKTKIAAIEFLGWGSHKSAVPALGKLFADENREVREKAQWAVSKIGLYEVHARDVVDWLGHPNREVKDAALYCLLRYTRDTPLVRNVVRPLVKLLCDEDRKVRIFAAIHLMSLDRGVMKSAFDQQGGEMRAVSDMLDSRDLTGGMFALLILAERGSPDARQYRRSPSVTLRLASVVALSRLGDAAVTDLLQLLSDKATEVREIAAYALGRIASKESIPGLEKAARDECANVRFRALIALGELSGLPEATLRVIVGSLLDPEASVREGAALVLVYKLGADAARVLPELLAALSSNDDEVRTAVLIALGEIKPRLGGRGAAIACRPTFKR